jgi:pre-rRNA-processing protein TSR3
MLIGGHREWGEKILEGFSWGHAFFEVNGGLLERYARCEDAEEIVKVQDAWLARLEKEWAESREVKDGEDEWSGGNPNQISDDYEREDDESEDEDEDEDEHEEEEEEK